MVIYIALRLKIEHINRWWSSVLPSQDGYGAAMPRLGSGIVNLARAVFILAFALFVRHIIWGKVESSR
jgi:hypothetical protein